MAKAELKKHDLEQVYLSCRGISVLVVDGQEVYDEELISLFPKYFSEVTKVKAPVVKAPVVEAPVVEAPVVEAPVEILTETSSTVEIEIIDEENKDLKVDFKKPSRK